MKYGYLDTGKASDRAKSAPLISSDGLKSYIEEFQAFANLSVTGHLDQETLEMMERPRCGVKDFVGHEFYFPIVDFDEQRLQTNQLLYHHGGYCYFVGTLYGRI